VNGSGPSTFKLDFVLLSLDFVLQVGRHSGASAVKFEQNLRLRLIEGEVGYDPDFEYTFEPPPKAAPTNSDAAGEG
jgi:hypothetical protein